MGKYDLSQKEGDTIVKIVKKVVDVLVKVSGGKPWFGK